LDSLVTVDNFSLSNCRASDACNTDRIVLLHDSDSVICREVVILYLNLGELFGLNFHPMPGGMEKVGFRGNVWVRRGMKARVN
jgi:hypothetical protein